MSDFLKSIVQVMADFLDKGEFRPAMALAGPGFASFVKRARGEVCFYLFVHDNRPGGGPLQVHMWVAPLDAPDDRLDKLMVGFKILVGETHEVTDEFFRAMSRRAGMLLDGLGGLVDVVEREMESPALVTRRLAAYREECRIYKEVRGLLPDEEPSMKELLNQAQLLVKGKGTLDKLERRATALLEQVLSASPGAHRLKMPPFNGNARLLGPLFAARLYTETLLASGR